MMTALLNARDAFRSIARVVTCEIGDEANMSPENYPMIRLVPVRVTPGLPMNGRAIDTNIIFGMALANPLGLTAVYQGLSDFEAEILAVLRTLNGRYVETVTDQDTLPMYKRMAIRCQIDEPVLPHVKAAIHATSVTLTQEAAVAAPLVPFARTLHISDAADWTVDLAAGEVERLLNGATTIRSRLTLTGFVTGPDGATVEIGILAEGTPVGNRQICDISTLDGPRSFEVVVPHTDTLATAYSAQVTGSEGGDYTFTDLKLVGEGI
jgi:hypothetical protein